MKRDALFNMVEQQIRPWDVSSPSVLAALFEMPRAGFLPESHKAFAYVDTELPLVIDGVDTQTHLLAPKVIARIVQAVNPQSHETVAQVGLGDGYLTALLAKFSKSVTAYELDENILRFAQNNLNKNAVRNVNYEHADGLNGSTEKFDILVLAGSISELSDAVKLRIHVGGRLFAVVGTPNAATMHAILVERIGENLWSQKVLFETKTPALADSHAHKNFEF